MAQSSTKTQINIKIDRNTKEQAHKLANKLGLSLSSIINASLKQFVLRREVHFALAKTMTPYTENIIADVEHDILRQRNLSKKFKNAEDAISHLRSL